MMIAEQISDKLAQAFQPFHLEVINESHMHNVPPGSESHFKVIIVASEFDGKRLLQRHRSVNKVLAEELAEQVHALALHTYTQQEWLDHYQANPPLSTKCTGGH